MTESLHERHKPIQAISRHIPDEEDRFFASLKHARGHLSGGEALHFGVVHYAAKNEKSHTSFITGIALHDRKLPAEVKLSDRIQLEA